MDGELTWESQDYIPRGPGFNFQSGQDFSIFVDLNIVSC